MSAQTGGPVWRHGLSLFGEVKYPPDFAHFDYVNPQAPKGGRARQIAIGTFDNFNMVVAGVKGALAAGIELTFDTLMTPALDEVSTQYGLLAESVAYPDDFSSAIYRLRPNAKWHDGNPVTAEDVIFSFEAFKQNDPRYAALYRHVREVGAKRRTRSHLLFRSSPATASCHRSSVRSTSCRSVGGKGSPMRATNVTSLEPRLRHHSAVGRTGSKSLWQGAALFTNASMDYWGRDLNVNVGQNNFDELRFEYFRDSAIAIEAFKADHVDWRTETSAKDWATAYDFPAISDGRVIKEEFPIRSRGIMQAFVFNLRRDQFKDPRVRQAFNLALDFEAMNRQFFFGQYERIGSFFEGTELAATDLPQGLELQILDGLRDQVPAEVFKTPFKNPVGGSPEAVRANLREATAIAAGGRLSGTQSSSRQ